MSEGGELKLSIVAEGKAASRLQQAFVDINSQSTIKYRISQPKEIDGEVVNVATRVDVQRGDPQYIWAITHVLERKYGFDCRIKK